MSAVPPRPSWLVGTRLEAAGGFSWSRRESNPRRLARVSEYVTHRGVLPKEALESLRGTLLSSRFVARSPLMGTFQGSRGFAVIFTEAGRATLEERFPFLRDYLAQVMEPRSWRGLLPWRERLLGLRPERRRPNAFYLNLLLLEAGRGVGPPQSTSGRRQHNNRGRSSAAHTRAHHYKCNPEWGGYSWDRRP